MAEYLRSLDRAGARPRRVNKHRQVISAVYGYGCARTVRLPSIRLPGTTGGANRQRRSSTSTSPRKSRRSPEPQSRRPPQRTKLRLTRRAAAASVRTTGRRAIPDRRLHRPALGRAARAALVRRRPGHRRLVVHRALSDQVEGPTKSWQARYLPIADRPRRRSPGFRSAENSSTRGLRLLLAPGPPVGRVCAEPPVQARRRGGRTSRTALPCAPARRRLSRRAPDRCPLGPGLPRSLQADTTERYLHAKSRPEDVDRLNRAFAVPPPPAHAAQSAAAPARQPQD